MRFLSLPRKQTVQCYIPTCFGVTSTVGTVRLYLKQGNQTEGISSEISFKRTHQHVTEEGVELPSFTGKPARK